MSRRRLVQIQEPLAAIGTAFAWVVAAWNGVIEWLVIIFTSADDGSSVLPSLGSVMLVAAALATWTLSGGGRALRPVAGIRLAAALGPVLYLLVRVALASDGSWGGSESAEHHAEAVLGWLASWAFAAVPLIGAAAIRWIAGPPPPTAPPPPLPPPHGTG